MFLPGAFWMKKDQPTFTLRQVGIICERLLKDYEDKVREEYEQILSTKLAGRLRRRVLLLLAQLRKEGFMQEMLRIVNTEGTPWYCHGAIFTSYESRICISESR